MFKKIWITNKNERYGFCNICFRGHSNVKYKININKFELPPTEKIDGKKISIEEAKEKNLIEEHFSFGIIDEDSLRLLHNAIENYFATKV